jgi:hypothetical protein
MILCFGMGMGITCMLMAWLLLADRLSGLLFFIPYSVALRGLDILREIEMCVVSFFLSLVLHGIIIECYRQDATGYSVRIYRLTFFY